MAAAAVTTLQRARHAIVGGVIVGCEDEPSPAAMITSLRGDHPLPGRRSFNAAQKIAETASGMRSDDLAIVLLSGGATSLIAAPLRGMAESDLGALFELLLGSGLDIRAVNAVRKRFTQWGAGRLALALAPARVFAFVMSDVPGDDPADIGSGPVTADATTVREVLDILQRSPLLPRIAPALRDYLTAVSRGVIPETPKRTHPAFAHVSMRVIGTNRLALDAICAHAAGVQLAAECAAGPLEGEAARCGTRIAETLLLRAQQGGTGCVVWGGETTVELAAAPPSVSTRGSASLTVLSSSATPADGGRCQELALSAARVLASAGEPGRRITLLAAGTDGRDGLTDAAGAFADSLVWDAIRTAGRDPELALRRHESHAALDAARALLPRRSTGTNVMDVVIGVVE